MRQESVTAYETDAMTAFADHRIDLSTPVCYYGHKDKQLRGRKQDPVFGIEAQRDLRPGVRLHDANWRISEMYKTIWPPSHTLPACLALAVCRLTCATDQG